jgi:NitT/TauT family transport system substrate-binding protein
VVRSDEKDLRLVSAVAIVAVGLGLLLAAGGPSVMPASGANAKVSVRLSYTPFAAHIPVYVAQARGLYAKAGLDVDILPGQGSGFATQVVGSGKEQFGIADAASVVTARARGVPIVSLGSLQQDSGVALFATKASGITRPQDIKGRKVGVFTGSVTEIFLKALLKRYGMTMNDIQPVTVRPGGDLPLVLNGGIEAEVSVYNNELTAWPIQHPALKLRIWRFSALGLDTPGYSLITNEALLKEQPQAVKGFVAATFEAEDWAIKHPNDAVDMLVEAVPELHKNVEMAKWRVMIPTSYSAATRANGLGAQDRAKWERLVTMLKTYEIIKQSVDLDLLLNSRFLPKLPG